MRKTVLNLANVVGGEALLRLANLVALVVIARQYGPGALGLYASALAAATVVTMIADNGLQTSAITEIGRSPNQIAPIVGHLLVAKTLLLIPAVGILAVIGSFASMNGPMIMDAFGVISFRVIVQSYCQLAMAVLKSTDRMTKIGKIQTLHFVFLLAGIALTVRLGWTMHSLLKLLVVGQMLELLMLAITLRRFGVRIQLGPVPASIALMFRSTPIGVTQALANGIFRLDVLVLSILAAPAEVGQFAAAHSFLIIVYVASWLVGSVLLPEMMVLLDRPKDLDSYLGRWSRRLLLLTVPIAITAHWGADPTLQALFGARFEASGRMAEVLMLAVPLIFLNSLHVNHALCRGWVPVFLGAHIATLFFSAMLGTALVLVFAGTGLAVAVILRELFMYLVLRLQGRRMTLQFA